MAASDVDYRCFVGGLSWNTTDRSLESAFRSCGSILDAKVVLDRDSGRPRGFGFVTFNDEASMEEAIESMHGKELDGRNITVSKAQPKSGGGDRGGSRSYGSGGGGGGGGYRGSGGRGDRSERGGSGGSGCFKCGESGHFARECPSGDSDGYSSRSSRGNGGGDRYSGGSRSGPYDRPSNSRSGGSRFSDY